MFTDKIKIRLIGLGLRGKAAGGTSRAAGRAGPRGRVNAGWSPARYRMFDWLKSGVVGLLLLSVVVSVVAGWGMALFATMLLAWALFPVLVGFRNALEAGCAFMLISVGVLVVVGVARHGPGAFLP